MSKNLSSSKHENQRKQSSKEFEGKFVCDVQSRQNSSCYGFYTSEFEYSNLSKCIDGWYDWIQKANDSGCYQICDKVSHMQKQYFLESSALKLTL